MLTIIADENIPMAAEQFASLGQVIKVDGRNLTAAQLYNADVLLVRSVTPVNQALLADTPVRFVASATIGTDHVDLDYLARNGIGFSNAPGCNAESVVDYVLSVLAAIEGGVEQALAGTVGIIGLGNVGGRLYRRLTALGMRCIGYDPLLEDCHEYQTAALDHVLACEVVCCHAPLTRTAPFPSWHMLDQAALQQLPKGGILINAGRGAVIDNQALLAVLARRPDLQVVLDVWEGEPRIERNLLPLVALATPHIAGYSFDGKLAGTRMIYQAVCQHLGFTQGGLVRPEPSLPISISSQNTAIDQLREAIWQVYDVREDDQRFRAAMACNEAEQAAMNFDQLRKQYPERREFSAKAIIGFTGSPQALHYLTAAGFEVNG